MGHNVYSLCIRSKWAVWFAGMGNKNPNPALSTSRHNVILSKVIYELFKSPKLCVSDPY